MYKCPTCPEFESPEPGVCGDCGATLVEETLEGTDEIEVTNPEEKSNE